MPIYEYECGKCGVFETSQRISEASLTKCPTCRRKVRRLISSTSFQLKGTGWYVTDYARGGADKKGDGDGEKKGDGDAEAKPESKTESSSETTPEKDKKAKPESKSKKADTKAGADTSAKTSATTS